MPPAFLNGLSPTDKTEGWRQNLLKHGATGRKRVRVAVSAGRVCGFVRVGCESGEPTVGVVYLLYVLPAHWGRGVGQALMRAALDELLALDVRTAVLWVLRDNQRARSFYERSGWLADGHTSTADYGGVALEAFCYRRAIP